MPRSRPLSKQDLAIARRIAWLRNYVSISREALAERAKIDPGFIARIELGRVPLRFRAATPLLAALGSDTCPVNPLWLADGKEPIQLEWPLLLPNPEDIGLDASLSFSDYVNTNRALLVGLVKFPPEAELPETWLRPYLSHWLFLRAREEKRAAGVSITECVFQFSAEALEKTSPTASELLAHYRTALTSIGSARTEWKDNLDTSADAGSVAGVKSKVPTWGQLKKEVAALTRGRGERSALANELKVTRQVLGNWLGDGSQGAPSAETTLWLLRWVREKRKVSSRPL